MLRPRKLSAYNYVSRMAAVIFLQRIHVLISTELETSTRLRSLVLLLNSTRLSLLPLTQCLGSESTSLTL